MLTCQVHARVTAAPCNTGRSHRTTACRAKESGSDAIAGAVLQDRFGWRMGRRLWSHVTALDTFFCTGHRRVILATGLSCLLATSGVAVAAVGAIQLASLPFRSWPQLGSPLRSLPMTNAHTGLPVLCHCLVARVLPVPPACAQQGCVPVATGQPPTRNRPMVYMPLQNQLESFPAWPLIKDCSIQR